MQFTFAHNNINVKDLDASIAFYQEALGLKETRRIHGQDGAFTIAYLGDGVTPHLLELTWLREHPQAYNLGENEIHLALCADNFEEAHEKHQEMGCICFENAAMGIYFIVDPDGYWVEIIPAE